MGHYDNERLSHKRKRSSFKIKKEKNIKANVYRLGYKNKLPDSGAGSIPYPVPKGNCGDNYRENVINWRWDICTFIFIFHCVISFFCGY